jgi:hypothetical protein
MEWQIRASLPELIELMPEIVGSVTEVPEMESDFPERMPGNQGVDASESGIDG